MMYFDHILVCGDIHGNLDIIPRFLKENELDNCAIIVTGDFGIGFENEKKEFARMRYLNNHLKNKKSIVYAVRGNHDDPQYFDGHFDTDFVKLIPDYTVLQLNQWNILCVGGATSVDRVNRNAYRFGKGRDWWKDEVFVYDENKVNQLKNIDFVVTHTTPHFAHPYTKGGLNYWIDKDIHLNTDIAIERHNVTMLYEHLVKNGNKIVNWYYGHYHMSNKMLYDNTYFTALDINEIQELKIHNTTIWE